MPKLVHDDVGEGRTTTPWKMEERSEKSDIDGGVDVGVVVDGGDGTRMAYWSISVDLIGYYTMLQMDY